jgi:hypothetical protein
VPGIIHLPDERHRTKKVTSGSENRQRTKAIRVRLHPADAERLKADAGAAGMSVAGYLAAGRLSDEAAPRPRIRRRAPVDEVALMRALAAFNRAHNNLNQITRTLNTLTLFAEEHGAARMQELLDELREPVAELREQFAAPVAAILEAVGHVREG